MKQDTRYNLTFTIEIASQYPQSSAGVGGSPGASVYLKVGAVRVEPAAIEKNGYYEMNIDKSNQAGSGTDMILIGTVGIPGNDFIYTLIQRNNSDNPFTIQSDSMGEIWAIIGTDSGFEGRSILYYNSIELKFVEQIVSVNEVPNIFRVWPSFPNPFNPTTTIRYEIPSECLVSLRIYDINGRIVAILEEGIRSAGIYNAVWEGKDKNGILSASGLYLYRLEAGNNINAGKILFLR